jgi:hypothetical protein
MGTQFSRGDETSRQGGQGRGTTDGIGPSWWDVRKLAQDLERMYGRKVGILIGPHECHNLWESPVLLVRTYLSVGGPWSSDTLWSSATFGGNSGRATVAGACYQALLELWDVASKRGAFMDY